MDTIKVHLDRVGNTLTIHWGDPATEDLCEEAGDDLVLIKDARGHVIGIEQLNVMIPEAQVRDVQVEVTEFTHDPAMPNSAHPGGRPIASAKAT